MVETTEVALQCPCGKQVFITRDEEGNPSVIHALPMCEHFEKLEPDEYLRWVRGTYEGKMDS